MSLQEEEEDFNGGRDILTSVLYAFCSLGIGMLTMIANAVTLDAVTVLDVTIIIRLTYPTQP